MAGDPQYAVARHLLELGEAVTQLREGAKLTRGQLGKLLRVKAQDIAIIEEETPRAPAGLLDEKGDYTENSRENNKRNFFQNQTRRHFPI